MHSFNSVAEAIESFRPWPWKYFHPDRDRKMACRGTGRIVIVPRFMHLMDQLRERFGRPIQINSWYRSPEHNAAVSKKTGVDGPHTTGEAVDISIYGDLALRLAAIAYELGFAGFGWKQTGVRSGRFLHLDCLDPSARHPRPWVWTY